jgi:hypothetical protein
MFRKVSNDVALHVEIREMEWTLFLTMPRVAELQFRTALACSSNVSFLDVLPAQTPRQTEEAENMQGSHMLFITY